MSDLLARMERVPFSRPHQRLLAMGGLGLAFDGLDVAILAFVLPAIKEQWHLTGFQAGLIGSSTLIGYLFGAVSAGMLGDRFGRRKVMMWALGIYGLATLLAAFSPTWQFFFIARLIAGIGTGAESSIIPAFLSEFAPGRLRGRFVGALAGFFSFGYVGAALLGRFIIPISEDGWRIAHLLCAVPLVMLLWWRRSVPESPRYLLSVGKVDEARLVVEDIERRAVKHLGRELPPVEASTVAETSTNTSALQRLTALQGLKALWRPGLAHRTSTLWMLWLVITFAFYGFFTFIPTLLVAGGLTITKSFSYSIVIYLAQIPGYYSAAYLNDKLDRKWTIAIYLTGGAMAAYMMSQSGVSALVMLWGALLSFFMNGVYSSIYAYTPEVYPTEIRASGMGVASGFGRIGGISAPLIIGATYPIIGFTGVFLMTAGALLFGGLAITIFGTSTKGRTLEDISGSVHLPSKSSLADNGNTDFDPALTVDR
ncbi:MFS transporter [Rhodococcus sp. JS3073]|uniref:MFS transporter n=1 Tax=Rhodococcus sp. JS3073 TaxID=3002901 RepID=UPI0022857392|nr:MFS transporter [Rhodococcus sp. JS3073]WAM19908.1 MFS transporter [Rhodococcus sp. JS3073]